MKLLAEQLAARGMLAVRFDYRHTGESAGAHDDPDAADGWIDSILEAIAYARSTGVDHVGVVGLRAGALLAAQAVVDERAGDISALVLWDPVTKGRNFVRGQQALAGVALGELAEAGVVNVIGASWHSDTAARLSAMTITPEVVNAVAGPMLTAVRDSEAGRPVTAALSEAGSDLLPIGDPAPFTEPPSFYVELPVRAIDGIADWLDARLPEATTTVSATIATAVTHRGPEGGRIRSEVFSDHAGLVVWQVSPVDAPARPRTLVTHATANDVRSGPARLWVETSWAAAEAGYRSVQYDRTGVAESGAVRRGDDFQPIYGDQSGLIAALYRLIGPNPVHAGICSGAWLAAIFAHAAAGDAGGSVIMVNQLAWRLRMAEIDRRRVVEMGIGPEADKTVDSSAAWPARIKPHVRAVTPYWLWRMLGRMGFMQVPHQLLAELSDAHVDISVVFSPLDHSHFLGQRGADAISRLRRRGARLESLVTDVGDHPGFHPALRRTITDVCLTTLARPIG